MTDKNKKRRCYLCGGDIDIENLSEDHVPPKGFFPKPNPPKIIKLPTHIDCNNDYDLDEEYLQIIISSTAAGWSDVAEEVWEEKFLPALHSEEKKGFLQRLIKETKPNAEVNDIHGKEVLKLPKIPVAGDRLERVLKKIVRGIYFSERGKRVEDTFSNIEIVGERQLGQQIKKPTLSIGTPGREEFKYLLTSSNNESTVTCQLQFYDAHWFKVNLYK